MDLMIDLETFGTGPRAVIASIGAVVFDYRDSPSTDTFLSPEIKDSNCFYKKIDARSQLGREFSPDTIYFWMNQPDAARKELIPTYADERKADYSNLVPLAKALEDFTAFCKQHKIEKMWCYGATFDHVIFMDAYKDMRKAFPISYRDLLDMRTFVYVMPKAERPTFGTGHNALDDSINQAIWMQKIWAEFIGHQFDDKGVCSRHNYCVIEDPNPLREM